jgi:DnaK suppressor protein
MNTKSGSRSKFASYRKTLEKKAEEIRRNMSAQKAAQVVSRLDCPSDEGDLSQQHHEEWIFVNRNSIDMKLLREISGALHRIEQETYGICAECEEPISAKRLDAVPWARYCITCQEAVAERIAAGDFVDDLEVAER